MRRIYTYENQGVCPVEEFFQKANRKIQDKLKYQLSYIADEHNGFLEPHIKHFSLERYRQLYELRLRAAGMMVRVIFCEQKGDVVLLHAFYKRNKKDTEKSLETAYKILIKISDENGNVSEEYKKGLVM